MKLSNPYDLFKAEYLFLITLHCLVHGKGVGILIAILRMLSLQDQHNTMLKPSEGGLGVREESMLVALRWKVSSGLTPSWHMLVAGCPLVTIYIVLHSLMDGKE